jgi:hypothetical protein
MPASVPDLAASHSAPLPAPAPVPPFLPQQPPPQPSQGTDTIEGGARAAGKRAGRRSARLASIPSEGAALPTPLRPWPGQTRAAHSLLIARGPRHCAPLWRIRSDPLASSAWSCWSLGDRRSAGRQWETTPRPPHAPTCLFRLKAQGDGLPLLSCALLSSRRSLLRLPPLSARSEWQRGAPPPRLCTKAGRGCAGCGKNRSPRGCREGGRRDTARMGSTPPPMPTIVPTRSGRGRDEPQSEGRAPAGLPQ